MQEIKLLKNENYHLKLYQGHNNKETDILQARVA